MMRNSVFRTKISSFVRFFIASFGGVLLDLVLSYCLVRFLGTSVYLATMVALAIAAGLMYFVHEFWTFGADSTGYSFPRFVGTVVSAGAALLVRFAVLSVADSFVGRSYFELQLLFAVGASFIVNYLLVSRIMSRSGVFKVNKVPGRSS